MRSAREKRHVHDWLLSQGHICIPPSGLAPTMPCPWWPSWVTAARRYFRLVLLINRSPLVFFTCSDVVALAPGFGCYTWSLACAGSLLGGRPKVVAAVTSMQTLSPAYSIAKTESDSTRVSAGWLFLPGTKPVGSVQNWCTVSPIRCAHWVRVVRIRLCRI